MKEETKPEMTAEELAKKYFPISDGFGHRKTYVEVQKNLRNEFLADLRSVIRGETSELLKQRDELKEALIDMVSQFAYRGTYEGRENLHTGGLSALESAFDALGLSDPITILDFDAAIKNTDG